ncbi:MAG: phage tail protein [Chloroflexota bacterium]
MNPRLPDILLRALTNSAFRFVVSIDGSPIGAFTECTLPEIAWDVEEVKEGGLNTMVHQLPGRRKSAKITLKNGVGLASDLLAWYVMTMNEQFWRRRVTVTLFDSMFIPVMLWHVEDAYPIRWTGPQLRTSDNTVAIQTLELACGEITVL